MSEEYRRVLMSSQKNRGTEIEIEEGFEGKNRNLSPIYVNEYILEKVERPKRSIKIAKIVERKMNVIKSSQQRSSSQQPRSKRKSSTSPIILTPREFSPVLSPKSFDLQEKLRTIKEDQGDYLYSSPPLQTESTGSYYPFQTEPSYTEREVNNTNNMNINSGILGNILGSPQITGGPISPTAVSGGFNLNYSRKINNKKKLLRLNKHFLSMGVRESGEKNLSVEEGEEALGNLSLDMRGSYSREVRSGGHCPNRVINTLRHKNPASQRQAYVPLSSNHWSNFSNPSEGGNTNTYCPLYPPSHNHHHPQLFSEANKINTINTINKIYEINTINSQGPTHYKSKSKSPTVTILNSENIIKGKFRLGKHRDNGENIGLGKTYSYARRGERENGEGRRKGEEISNKEKDKDVDIPEENSRRVKSIKITLPLKPRIIKSPPRSTQKEELRDVSPQLVIDLDSYLSRNDSQGLNSSEGAEEATPLHERRLKLYESAIPGIQGIQGIPRKFKKNRKNERGKSAIGTRSIYTEDIAPNSIINNGNRVEGEDNRRIDNRSPRRQVFMTRRKRISTTEGAQTPVKGRNLTLELIGFKDPPPKKQRPPGTMRQNRHPSINPNKLDISLSREKIFCTSNSLSRERIKVAKASIGVGAVLSTHHRGIINNSRGITAHKRGTARDHTTYIQNYVLNQNPEVEKCEDRHLHIEQENSETEWRNSNLMKVLRNIAPKQPIINNTPSKISELKPLTQVNIKANQNSLASIIFDSQGVDKPTLIGYSKKQHKQFLNLKNFQQSIFSTQKFLQKQKIFDPNKLSLSQEKILDNLSKALIVSQATKYKAGHNFDWIEDI